MNEVTKSVQSLHALFLQYFGGSVPSNVYLKRFNAQYRCPNKECPTNIVGHRSYGKLKFSVTFDIFKYHCWVCEDKGSVSHVIKTYFDDRDITQAFKYREVLLKHYAHHSKDVQSYQNIKEYTDDFEPLLSFDDESDDYLKNKVLDYAFKVRGLTYDHIYFYKLMFARKGRYQDMLIIPSFNEHNRINYFIGRSIDKYPRFKFSKPEIPKGSIIFNEPLINWNEQLILTEGPIDYLHLHGFNRTFVDGSSLGNDSLLLNKLKCFRPTVKILFDVDAIEKAQKLEIRLKRFGIPAKVVTSHLIKAGIEDAGELREQTDAFVRDILNESADTHVMNSLREKLNRIAT